MATPQTNQQHSTQFDAPLTTNRLVWIINRDVNAYKADFQGLTITIPPNLQKIPKHVRDGGNLMEYLAARRFITDLKQPQMLNTDRLGKVTPVFGPKMLIDQELTDEEREEITGKTKKDLKVEAAKEEKQARKKLTEELKKVPNKIAAEDEDE